SMAILLRENGEAEAASRVVAAVTEAIVAGETTRDLGGSLGTRAAAAAVCGRL
ncbi:isocitrate/isopropylmalate dehydrogenase family protein, partial [bacterium]|nr:isocitrate/isopropylmalate dehydrogenase family protein [bacterium]